MSARSKIESMRDWLIWLHLCSGLNNGSRFPSIIQLSIHLPGQHRVLFQDNERLEDVIERTNTEKSTLTAWFHANTIYLDAKQSTYADFPIRWVYNNQTKSWKPRQRGDSIVRIYFIHPIAGENII